MLINLRNALMAGKRLPYDAEVEYLESTVGGGQYIDTGYVFQYGDVIETAFQPLSTPTQTAYFFGADASFNNGLNVHYDPTAGNTGVRFCYGGNSGTQTSRILLSPIVTYSTTTTYYCNGDAAKRTINNGENSYEALNSGLSSYSVVLFCGRRNAQIRPISSGWAVPLRFFYFRVYRNGVLVRDYIPVRVGTVGYLYDRVSGKLFGNAGTGDFVLGPDKN